MARSAPPNLAAEFHEREDDGRECREDGEVAEDTEPEDAVLYDWAGHIFGYAVHRDGHTTEFWIEILKKLNTTQLACDPIVRSERHLIRSDLEARVPEATLHMAHIVMNAHQASVLGRAGAGSSSRGASARTRAGRLGCPAVIDLNSMG